jgi:hypothetical protein
MAFSLEEGVGIGYAYPVSREISHPYGGGISIHSMCEIPVDRVIRIAAEVGYHRSSAHLPHPDFIDSAKGTLQSIPVDLIARFAIPHSGVIRPHIGAGIELLWMKERFSYRMLTHEAVRSPDARFGVGPTLVAGVDRTEFPRLRIEAAASVVPLRRGISAGSGGYDAERITAGFFGARIIWKLP